MSTETETETMKLACVLDASEKDMKARELVRELNSQLQLEVEKKDLVKDFVEQIKLSKRRTASLARQIETGTEEREVPIERRKLFAGNMVEVWRLDTNELISRRAMDAAERQREMFEGADVEPLDDEKMNELAEASAVADAEAQVDAAFPGRRKKQRDKSEPEAEPAPSHH